MSDVHYKAQLTRARVWRLFESALPNVCFDLAVHSCPNNKRKFGCRICVAYSTKNIRCLCSALIRVIMQQTLHKSVNIVFGCGCRCRLPKLGFRNSNLRVYLSTFDVGSPDGLYSVRDIEGDPLAISLDAKDEKAMAAVLRRNFHPGGLVSVLSKNRMSHCEEQSRAIRRGEQKAIRPARSQHHSHFVNPFRDEG